MSSVPEEEAEGDAEAEKHCVFNTLSVHNTLYSAFSISPHMTVEARISEVAGKASAVLLTAKAELSRRVIYVTRARMMTDAIRNTLQAMTEVEAHGLTSDFTDDWRHMRLTLAHAQSQFQSVIDCSGETTLPPCQPRPHNSRDWI